MKVSSFIKNFFWFTIGVRAFMWFEWGEVMSALSVVGVALILATLLVAVESMEHDQPNQP